MKSTHPQPHLIAYEGNLSSRNNLDAALFARLERDRALLHGAVAVRAAAIHDLVAQRVAIVRRLRGRGAREPNLRGPEPADLHRSFSELKFDRVRRNTYACGLRVLAAEGIAAFVALRGGGERARRCEREQGDSSGNGELHGFGKSIEWVFNSCRGVYVLGRMILIFR